MHPILRKVLFLGPKPARHTGNVTQRIRWEELAIPLTAHQADELVDALRMADASRHRSVSGNTSYIRRQADVVAARAGAALASGSGYVPQPISEMHIYGNVLEVLMHSAPGSPETLGFDNLLKAMHALSGMAAVHNWRVTELRGVLVWEQEPLPASLAAGWPGTSNPWVVMP